MVNRVKGYKIVTLNRDIKRGVKSLSDRSYGYGGISQFSLKFWDSVKTKVGQVYFAKLVENKNGYHMVMKTRDGYTLTFFGCSFGYYGEGCRASHDILLSAGFSEKQADRVFNRTDKKQITFLNVKDTRKHEEKCTCIGCKKTPEEIPEYRYYGKMEGITATQFVKENESTYNKFEKGKFYCTSCYISAGIPLIQGGE